MLRPLVLAALGGALLTPSAVLACSCAAGAFQALPSGEGVPTNARVVVKVLFADPADTEVVRLLDDEGQIVPSTAEVRGGGSLDEIVLTPDAPLVDGTTYTLESRMDWDQDGTVDESWELTRFTVGGGADEQPPEPPELLGTRIVRDPVLPFGGVSSCGESMHFVVDLEPGVDERPGVLTEIEITEQEGEPVTFLTEDVAAWAGRGGCGGYLPEIAGGQAYFARIRAVDLAGNASEWVSMDAPRPTGGCNSLGGSPPPGSGGLPGGAAAGLVVGLALALGRRRRGR